MEGIRTAVGGKDTFLVERVKHRTEVTADMKVGDTIDLFESKCKVIHKKIDGRAEKGAVFFHFQRLENNRSRGGGKGWQFWITLHADGSVTYPESPDSNWYYAEIAKGNEED